MIASKTYQKPIQHKRYARNGAYPEGSFLGRLVNRQNHAMAYRRKTFMTWGDAETPMTAVAGATVRFRFRCHTGYGATHMGFVIASGLDDKQTVDPLISISATISGGATTTETIYTPLNSAVATNAPSEWTWHYPRVAVTANTEYEVEVSTDNYAVIMSIMAYEIASPEVDSAVPYYAEIEPGSGYPVYDSTRQTLLEGMSKMWAKNGAHLYTYPGDGSGTGVTYASTTWVNIIDGSSSSAADIPGIYLPTLNQKSRQSDNETTIDVILAVYASCTTAAVGELRLYDTTAATSRCSITGIGTAAAWYTSQTTITAIDELGKLDIQARVSATPRTLTLYAASLFCFWD